ncbi:CYFA0S39e00088g1_1 [Cyberlindnera fabianii]|uniref:CYFA0S39e00088g1_1 n=1 Tax=Cyberlindnera fabianii TaxID=36022 RepID=A0A061BES5_CYBFA|nr:CYFA0S39e00088g1_1 [Cyberlindnera fabianii]
MTQQVTVDLDFEASARDKVFASIYQASAAIKHFYKSKDKSEHSDEWEYNLPLTPSVPGHKTKKPANSCFKKATGPLQKRISFSETEMLGYCHTSESYDRSMIVVRLEECAIAEMAAVLEVCYRQFDDDSDICDIIEVIASMSEVFSANCMCFIDGFEKVVDAFENADMEEFEEEVNFYNIERNRARLCRRKKREKLEVAVE